MLNDLNEPIPFQNLCKIAKSTFLSVSKDVPLSRENMLLMQLQYEMDEIQAVYSKSADDFINDDELSAKEISALMKNSKSPPGSGSRGRSKDSPGENYVRKDHSSRAERESRLFGCALKYPHEALRLCNIPLSILWEERFKDREVVSWHAFQTNLTSFMSSERSLVGDCEIDFLLSSKSLIQLKSSLDIQRQESVSIYDLCLVLNSLFVFAEHPYGLDAQLPRRHESSSAHSHCPVLRWLPLRYLIYLLSRGLRGARVLMPLPEAPLPLRSPPLSAIGLQQLCVDYAAAYAFFLRTEPDVAQEGGEELHSRLSVFQAAPLGILDTDAFQSRLCALIARRGRCDGEHSQDWPSTAPASLRYVCVRGASMSGKTARVVAAAHVHLHHCQESAAAIPDSIYVDLRGRVTMHEILAAFNSQLCLCGTSGGLPLSPSPSPSPSPPHFERDGCLASLLLLPGSPLALQEDVEAALQRLVTTLSMHSVIILDHVAAEAAYALRCVLHRALANCRQELAVILITVGEDVDGDQLWMQGPESIPSLRAHPAHIEVPRLPPGQGQLLIQLLLLRQLHTRSGPALSSPSSSLIAWEKGDLRVPPSHGQSAAEFLLDELVCQPAREVSSSTISGEHAARRKLRGGLTQIAGGVTFAGIVSALSSLSCGLPGLLKVLLSQSVTTILQLTKLHRQKATFSTPTGSEGPSLTLQSLFFESGCLEADDRLLVHCLSPLMYKAYCVSGSSAANVVFSKELAWELSEVYFDITKASTLNYAPDRDDGLHATYNRFCESWDRLIKCGLLVPAATGPLRGTPSISSPSPSPSPRHQRRRTEREALCLVRFCGLPATSTRMKMLSEKRLLGFAAQFPFFCDLTSGSYAFSGMCRFEFDAQIRRYLGLMVRQCATIDGLLKALNHIADIPDLHITTSLIAFQRRQILLHLDSSLLLHYEFVIGILVNQLTESPAAPDPALSTTASASASASYFTPPSNSRESHRRLWSQSSNTTPCAAVDGFDYQDAYHNSNRSEMQLLQRQFSARDKLEFPAKDFTPPSEDDKVALHLKRDYAMVSVAEIFQLIGLLLGRFADVAISRLSFEGISQLSKVLYEVGRSLSLPGAQSGVDVTHIALDRCPPRQETVLSIGQARELCLVLGPAQGRGCDRDGRVSPPQLAAGRPRCLLFHAPPRCGL